MNPERRLLLIKHSLPEILTGLDAHVWRLSNEGRTRSTTLAAALVPYSPTMLATSREPKTQETAEIVGRELNVPVEAVADLHEVNRTGVPWLDRDQFEAAVRSFFDRPGECVFGNESAGEALARFRSVIDGVLARHPVGTVAVVAHGTVIGLYVAAVAGVEPFPLWHRLDLPSFVVLALPSGRLVEVVERV